MTNNTITVMKKELARFFGDRRLVITTLLLPGIMIYVVGKVSAGGRGSTGTVGSVFSVIEMSMGFLPVLPAGGMDVCPQFTV